MARAGPARARDWLGYGWLMTHSLLDVLLEAARGRPPEPDGTVEVLPPLPGPVEAAVVAFTAHSYLVADVGPELARSRLRDGDPGAPTRPAFLTWLGEQLGSQPGQLDAVLAAPGLDGARPLELEPRTDLEHHHRVARANHYRRDLRVFTSPGDGGVLVLGRGLAGRWEAAFEVEPEWRGQGLGRTLALAARHLVPRGEPLFVQVSPGNAASLRAVLAAGYRPLGSEVLFPPAG
jgi:GNAT superfamily N-acetyltransferase